MGSVASLVLTVAAVVRRGRGHPHRPQSELPALCARVNAPAPQTFPCGRAAAGLCHPCATLVPPLPRLCLPSMGWTPSPSSHLATQQRKGLLTSLGSTDPRMRRCGRCKPPCGRLQRSMWAGSAAFPGLCGTDWRSYLVGLHTLACPAEGGGRPGIRLPYRRRDGQSVSYVIYHSVAAPRTRDTAHPQKLVLQRLK
jgi:hypothetical protein